MYNDEDKLNVILLKCQTLAAILGIQKTLNVNQG